MYEDWVPAPTVEEKGPSVGQFQGRDIPAYLVTSDGRRHVFVGVAESPFELELLRDDECVVSPGLIYRRESCC